MRRQPKAQTLAPLAGNRGFESISLQREVPCKPETAPPRVRIRFSSSSESQCEPGFLPICGAAPVRRCAAIRHGAARVRLIRRRPRKLCLSCDYLREVGSIALYPNPAKNLMCFSYLITHPDPTNLPRCRPPSPVSFWRRAVPEISVWFFCGSIASRWMVRSDSTQAPSELRLSRGGHGTERDQSTNKVAV